MEGSLDRESNGREPGKCRITGQKGTGKCSRENPSLGEFRKEKLDLDVDIIFKSRERLSFFTDSDLRLCPHGGSKRTRVQGEDKME